MCIQLFVEFPCYSFYICRVYSYSLSFTAAIRVLYHLSFLWRFCQRLASSSLSLWLERVNTLGHFCLCFLVVFRLLASSVPNMGYIRRKQKPDEFPTVLFLWTQNSSFSACFPLPFRGFYVCFTLWDEWGIGCVLCLPRNGNPLIIILNMGTLVFF